MTQHPKERERLKKMVESFPKVTPFAGLIQDGCVIRHFSFAADLKATDSMAPYSRLYSKCDFCPGFVV